MTRKRLRISAMVATFVFVLASCSTSQDDGNGAATPPPPPEEDVPRIAVVTKLDGIPYFEIFHRGFDQAVAELSGEAEFVWTGPSNDEASEQIRFIQDMISAEMDVIAVNSTDAAAIAPVLQQAVDAGINVMTWCSDADIREAFVDVVSAQVFGETLVDLMVEQIGDEGQIAIITSTLTSPNGEAWRAGINARLEESYPNIEVVAITEAREDTDLARQHAEDLVRAHPDLDGIIALHTPTLPGVAQAIESLGMAGEIAVIGNSLPSVIQQYFESGVLEKAALWNPVDAGYLIAYTAYALANDGLAAGVPFDAGRLGEYTPTEDDTSLFVLLGEPLIITSDNVDSFDF